MAWLVFKYLTTAALVVAVSELAKRHDRWGAALAALPLVTVLTLVWLHVEKQPASKLASHASLTFWYVLPTLPMFLLLPWLLGRLGFWAALLASAAITVVGFLALASVLRRFGVFLLP
jgi:hypothetical protein